jgi:hypothetical protein
VTYPHSTRIDYALFARLALGKQRHYFPEGGRNFRSRVAKSLMTSIPVLFRRSCKTVELIAVLYASEGLMVANVGRAGALQIDIGRLRLLLDAVASSQREPMSLPITAAAWVIFSALVAPLSQCDSLSVLTHSQIFGRLLSGHGYVVRCGDLRYHNERLDTPPTTMPAAMQGS